MPTDTRSSQGRRTAAAALAAGLALMLPLRTSAQKPGEGVSDPLAITLDLFRGRSQTPPLLRAATVGCDRWSSRSSSHTAALPPPNAMYSPDCTT